MIHSPEYFGDGKKISQPVAYLMPGLKPALDLCFGNDCEPQQHMSLVKELSGMGRGELNTIATI